MIGSCLGIIFLICDFYLDKNNHNFRLHLMPVAVGIYLPFGLSTPILIGGLVSHFVWKGVKVMMKIQPFI